MFAHALTRLLQVQVPGAPEHRIQSIFRPMATPAADQYRIALLTLAITGAIFGVVALLIVYTMVRFRRRHDHDTLQEPPQVYGSNQIEAAWTVIPILIVFVLIGVSVRVIAGVENHSPPHSMLKVNLIGHQWWWEVQYPDYGVTTANEIHIPATGDGSHAAYLRLTSVDVIHSFWVPQLSGKTDLIPNRVNFMWIDPHETGVYVGNCAEYCGTQHANMAFTVVAEDSATFAAWLAQQRAPASVPTDPLAARGMAVFWSARCAACHTVRGTASDGLEGPDLTHLATRQSLGAGLFANGAGNLAGWVSNAPALKPGIEMPATHLDAAQLRALLAYLGSLK